MNEKTEGSIEFDPFAGPELALTAPSTEPQREIWTAVQMGDDASCAFNESVTLTLRGALDVAALGAAWNDLVARHESLRTTFSPDGLTLCVAASQLVDMPLLDFSASDAHAREAAWKAVLAREVETAFNLERGPLLRVNLVRMTDSEHRVTVTAHHIVCDGWSMAVMLRDLGELYSARRGSPAATLKPAFAFSDYARAQEEQARTEEFAADEAYWLKRFAGSIPVLDLPVDRTRPPAKTYTSRREDYVLEASLVEAVKKVGLRAGCSFFTTLLAGFEVLLYRLSGQDDLVVGIPAAGQSVAGQDSLVGHCVNMLPLRSALDGTQPFTEFLKRVRTTMLDAYDHQKFTFGTLLKKLPLPRDPSRLPLVSVLFNVDQAINGTTLNYAGLEVEFHSTPRHFENFDIFINAAETNGRVVVETQYNSDLFDPETIHRWLSTFEVLLRSIAADASGALERLPILPEADRAKVLGWNDTTAMPYARELCTHELFEAQARERPDATAILFGETRITYGELDARANRAARVLRDAGAGRGSLVGLAMERSIDLIVGLLAILKTGSAYVPLDPAYPKDRIEHMITDSQMPVILTQAALVAALPAHGAKVVTLEETASGDAAPLPRDAGVATSATPEDSAYVIYTSGSTGKPKGVLVPHRAVVNFLTTMRETPGMTSGDVVLAVTTLSFDIAVLELHLPLSLGATIVLASREVAGDGALLLAAIKKHGVTVMQATPSTWRLLLAAGWKGGDAFKAICGGEALPRDLAGELVRRAADVWNMYGPTETTVWSTCYRLPKPAGRILIGKPIGNTQVYILDTHLQPVPIGVPGELHIGGDGVTHGYLHRAELTAERFIADPFRGGNKIYKTGDLARFLPDGNIEYLRRNDNQVKVRGFRIELGEIEVALATHPGVKQAVVVVREDRPGDVRLVGYVVPQNKTADTSDAALRAHLRTGLPEYMVPQHFVELDAVPLTPNGKVDRRALPAPQLGAGDSAEAYLAPRSDAEKLLAEIWQEILGISRVSVNDNFFNLGGHSLLAAQVMTRLSRDHGIALPMRRLFEAPTIAALATHLSHDGPASTQAQAIRIPRRLDDKPAPLSLMQQRIWYLEELAPESLVYNLPSAFRIKGKLNLAAFQRAIDTIVERHDALRTSLKWEGDAPIQLIAPTLKLDVTSVVDLSDRSLTQREPELLKLLEEEANFHLRASVGPLVKAKMYKLAENEWVFFYMPHHAVFDGWSFDTFLNELDLLYGAYAQGKPSPLPELPITYSDFSAWHREWLQGEELERQRTYWLQQLSGDLPLLGLQTDKPRPQALSLKGATEPFKLTKAESEALTALGRRAGGTLYMVLLAAFKATLARWTGKDDILVGTPVRGRSWPETENLLGFFVNTLVFRTSLAGAPSFEELLGRVRTTMLDAFSHQDMPFELLVQALKLPRDNSRTPVYQAFFSFQDVSNRKAFFGDLPYGQVHVHAEAAPTDIFLWVKETGDGVVGGLDYATDLFDQATIVRFLKTLRTLLANVVQNPQADITLVNILPETERRQLAAWNESAKREVPPNTCYHHLFEERAAAAPDAPAVTFGDTTISYGELNRRANRLARKLRAMGAKTDVLVGIWLERSIDMVVAFMATLKAGATYVPVDPNYPPDRVHYIIGDSKMAIFISESALAPHLPSHEAQVVLLDSEADAIGREPDENLPRSGDADAATPASRVYVIYTSGSTGKPKGVEVTHGNVVNYVRSALREPGTAPDDVMLAVVSLAFDVHVSEYHVPLAAGARVVIAPGEAVADGERLVELIDKNGVTFMSCTPATYRLIVNAGWKGSRRFKLTSAGDTFPRHTVNELRALGVDVWNSYGPTETTVVCTMYHVTEDEPTPSIGHAMDNTTLHVLDAHMQHVPIGVPGELWIGGEVVARGYLNRPDLTKERFIPDPFSEAPGARLYRSGDVVRFRPDGNLDFVGRNDNQVKLRGYRIELGEIENALARIEGVKEAAVVIREDRPGDRKLVGYTVPKPGADYTESELRKALRKSLPDYMVPQAFVELDAFPLSPNKKVDRKALPAPQGAGGAPDDDHVEPRTDAERLVAGVWREVLGIAHVSVHDNFFNIGGHSLSSIQVIGLVEKQTGKRLTPRNLLFGTLEQVANELGPVGGASAEQTAAASPSTAQSTAPAASPSPSVAPTSPSTPPRPSTSPSAPPGAGAVPLAKRMFDKLKSTIQRK